MFKKGIVVEKSDRGLGLRPSDIFVNRDLRGRRYGPAEDRVAGMVESMRTEGQKQNIVVYATADGRPAVKAGYTRLEAAQRIEQEDPGFLIWANYEPGDGGIGCFKTTLVENLERNEVSDVDSAFSHEILRRKYGWTDAQIARFYRWDASRVCRVKKLLLLPEPLQRAVHDGQLSTAAGIAYSELPPEEQREAWESKVVTVAELHERVRRKQAAIRTGATPAAPSPAAPARGKPAEQPATPQPAEPSTLNFKRLDTASPVAKTRQRTLGQVKDLLTQHTGSETPAALKAFSAALLAFITGTCDEAEYARRVSVR